jgi:hypothetical protein
VSAVHSQEVKVSSNVTLKVFYVRKCRSSEIERRAVSCKYQGFRETGYLYLLYFVSFSAPLFSLVFWFPHNSDCERNIKIQLDSPPPPQKKKKKTQKKTQKKQRQQ